MKAQKHLGDLECTVNGVETVVKKLLNENCGIKVEFWSIPLFSRRGFRKSLQRRIKQLWRSINRR
jgi:hypothetical protein